MSLTAHLRAAHDSGVTRWRGKLAVGSRGLAVAVLGLTLAVTSVLGGRGYVWCAPMAEARAHCCCPHRPAEHDAIRVDCCDDRTAPSLPSAERTASAAPFIAPSLRVAVLSLEEAFGCDALHDVTPGYALRTARAGPDQRVHASASVYLI